MNYDLGSVRPQGAVWTNRQSPPSYLVASGWGPLLHVPPRLPTTLFSCRLSAASFFFLIKSNQGSLIYSLVAREGLRRLWTAFLTQNLSRFFTKKIKNFPSWMKIAKFFRVQHLGAVNVREISCPSNRTGDRPVERPWTFLIVPRTNWPVNRLIA